MCELFGDYEQVETEEYVYLDKGGGHLPRIPMRMFDGINRYLFYGIFPGGFLTYIFMNDFVKAAGKADYANAKCLYGYAFLLYNYVPLKAWGSEEKMLLWQNEGALMGMDGFKGKEWIERQIERFGRAAYLGVEEVLETYDVEHVPF